MRVLGIDIGLDGAMALVTEYGVTPVYVRDLPTVEVMKGRRELDAHVFIEDLVAIGPVDMVVIERLQAMPKNGSQTAFSQGHSFGMVRGILAALDRPVTIVRPADWKKTVGYPAKAGKDWGRQHVAQLYPNCADLVARVKDADRADAILIARSYLVSRHGQVAA